MGEHPSTLHRDRYRICNVSVTVGLFRVRTETGENATDLGDRMQSRVKTTRPASKIRTMTGMPSPLRLPAREPRLVPLFLTATLPRLHAVFRRPPPPFLASSYSQPLRRVFKQNTAGHVIMGGNFDVKRTASISTRACRRNKLTLPPCRYCVQRNAPFLAPFYQRLLADERGRPCNDATTATTIITGGLKGGLGVRTSQIQYDRGGSVDCVVGGLCVRPLPFAEATGYASQERYSNNGDMKLTSRK